MKFAPDLDDGSRNRISSYGADYVIVAGLRHERNIIVTAERVISGWGPADAAELSSGHMQELAQLTPEIVLIGTGRRLRFPPQAIMESLPRLGIGLEFMDTGAACRSYNYLLGESRRVVAALIIP
ncbi:MAG: Mth938-like domain-containing protein [Gammaproteobacteria bacterium]|nr:Mth938-like domain-containing protein [Gammaproteobacteria bacterium]